MTQVEAQIPIIDLTQDDEKIVETIRHACLNSGFFQIVNHGVPRGLQDSVLRVTKEFFALPMQKKLDVDFKKSPAKRGYEAGQQLEADANVDSKEGFYFGEDLPPDDPRVRAGKFGHGTNQLPNDIPEFNQVLTEYYNTMKPLAIRLFRYLALSLDLPKDFFDNSLLINPYAIIRILHYPPSARNADAKDRGAGAHTDFGNLTLLMTDGNPGLEVRDNKHGGWLKPTPIDRAYIVNLGDAISRWTNNRYKSTVHRVINPSPEKDRYSVPFFFSGNLDCMIQCLPTCVEGNEKPKYPPIRLEDHYKERYATTYGSAKGMTVT